MYGFRGECATEDEFLSLYAKVENTTCIGSGENQNNMAEEVEKKLVVRVN